MEEIHLRLLLLQCVLLVVGVSGQCPTSCVCEDRQRTITCTAIASIPRNLPRSTVYFSLQQSSIPTLENGIFDGEELPNLKKITLSYSGIQEIQPRAFSNLDNLEDILLDGNELVRLSNRTFYGLRFRSLNLDNNARLSIIEDNAFEDTVMEELHLRKCNFTTLTRASLEAMSEVLKELHLTNNTAPLELPPGLFARFNFRFLDLSDNDMSASSLAAFQDVNADDLDMSNICIGDVIWDIVEYANSIHDLEMRRVCTNITKITKDIQLTSLSLEGNYIRNIEPNDFRFANKIYSLILRDNLISAVPAQLGSFLESLTILDLRGNRIRSLGPGDLDPFMRLQLLNVRGNLIQTLPSALSPYLSRLRTFDIRDNPLHCNCELAWFSQWIRALGYNDTKVSVGTCVTPEAGPFLSLRPSVDFRCSRPMVVFAVTFPEGLGGKATFACNVTGDPQPSVSLSLNGQEVTSFQAGQDRTVIESSLEHIISDFQCSMIGQYSCAAINVAGPVTRNMNVGQNIDPKDCLTTEAVQPTMSFTSTTSSMTSSKAEEETTTMSNIPEKPTMSNIPENPTTSNIPISTTSSTSSSLLSSSSSSTTSKSAETTSTASTTISTQSTETTQGGQESKEVTTKGKDPDSSSSKPATGPLQTDENLSTNEPPELSTKSQSHVTESTSSGKSDVMLPLIIVIVLLVVLVAIVTAVVVTMRMKAKKYAVDGRPKPRQPEEGDGYENKALEKEDKI